MRRSASNKASESTSDCANCGEVTRNRAEERVNFLFVKFAGILSLLRDQLVERLQGEMQRNADEFLERTKSMIELEATVNTMRFDLLLNKDQIKCLDRKEKQCERLGTIFDRYESLSQRIGGVNSAATGHTPCSSPIRLQAR